MNESQVLADLTSSLQYANLNPATVAKFNSLVVPVYGAEKAGKLVALIGNLEKYTNFTEALHSIL